MEAPHRVLHIQTGSGLEGGIAGYIGELVRARSLEHFDAVVVVPDAALDPVRVRALYGHAVAVRMPPTYSLWSLPAYVRSLRREVRNCRIDVIHAHALRSAFAAIWVSLSEGVPLVYTNHGLRFTQKTSVLAAAAFWLMEWLVCKIACQITAIRPFDHSRLRRARLVSPSKLHLVETRINAPKPIWPPRGGDELPLLVGLGSLVEVKRPDRFVGWLRALSALGVSYRAVWIGDGPLRAALERDSLEFSLPIEVTGHLARERVFGLLATAYALLLTSQFEVFPLAVLEAYSQGVPVVSGRFDGVEDFIMPAATGILVDADDAAMAASSIARLISDTPFRERLGRNALALYADRFRGSETMSLAYDQQYVAALAGMRRATGHPCSG